MSAQMSIAELQAELHRRKKEAKKLAKQRAKLLKQLASVEAKLAAAGGAAGGRVRSGGLGQGAATRKKNSMNLLEALCQVLKGKTMSVTDAAAAVQKAGYKTSSPHFRVMVNGTLLKKRFFKRVERGMYTAA